MLINRRSFVAGASAAGLAGLAMPGLARAQDGRVLVVATTAVVNSFDPHINGDLQTTMLMRNIYDGLLTAEGNPPRLSPRLATEWTVSDDGMEYTFKLNPTAKFHDGSPVDASAVKYSFDRIRRIGRGNAWMIRGIIDDNSLEVVDSTTLKIRLASPFSAFLKVLPWISVVNPTILEANKGADDGITYLQSNEAGSGPFRLARYAQADFYQFERVPDGWRQGGGNLTGYYWRIVRETATQRLLVDRGDAHLAIDLNSGDVDAVRQNPAINVVMEPDYQTFMMRMNVLNGPLTDVHLRRAISYAVNYQGLLDVAGYADLMEGPVPPTMPGHDPALRIYRQDLEAAKAELAKSAYPDGGITLVLSHSATLEPPRRYASVLLDSLRALNITVDARPVTFAEGVAALKSEETRPDIYCIYTSSAYPDPDNVFFGAYHSSVIGGWQNPFYNNPAMDELALKGRSEPLGASRDRIYNDLQKLVVDDAPDVFGVIERRKLTFRNNVTGFEFCPLVAQAVDFFPLSIT